MPMQTALALDFACRSSSGRLYNGLVVLSLHCSSDKPSRPRKAKQQMKSQATNEDLELSAGGIERTKRTKANEVTVQTASKANAMVLSWQRCKQSTHVQPWQAAQQGSAAAVHSNHLAKCGPPSVGGGPQKSCCWACRSLPHSLCLSCACST